MLITVDGLAGSGKGTLASALGKHFNLDVLDTGAMWRVLAWQMYIGGFNPDTGPETLERGAHIVIERGLRLDLVEDPRIRTEQVGNFASVISCFPNLRRRINSEITAWATRPEGGILDGRDTGIANAPHAEHKFFLFATVLARGQRRARQLGSKDGAAAVQSIMQRDKREITRVNGAVRPAPGAILIDTTFTTARAAEHLAIDAIEASVNWAKLRDEAFIL